MNLRPILYVIGILLSILAIAMMIPMLIDIHFGNSDWKIFFLCVLATAFFGGSLVLGNTTDEPFSINVRQAFLLTTLSWLTLATFASLPLWLSQIELSFTDAFFEAMSGITTTGSTVIVGLDNAPPGLLLWRAILQWLGGIGVIVMALAVLPFLKVGGMQLFRTESSEKNKTMPRATQLASSIGIIYLALTIVCAVCYHFAGMTVFDAFAHAMTTVATGGFSTFDSSFGHYQKPWIEITAIFFMLMGGLPFVLYVKAVNGNPGALFRDSQVRWFLSIVAACILALSLYLISSHDMGSGEALRRAAFNIVSLITGTGYASYDYNQWHGFGIALLFFVMVVGGCAGSTTCGIKIFRFQVLYTVTDVQFKKLLHPHGVFLPYYGGRPLPEGIPGSVMSFFFIYAVCFALLALALSYVGLDFTTALSGAVTAISNVGPGLGDVIGPTGTFAPLPDSAKWILSAGMLLGRLELFTVLVMLSPSFWRR